MKVLVISNHYPPFHGGGYELGCEDVVNGLKARGHHVKVLTCTLGAAESKKPDIERILERDGEWLSKRPLSHRFAFLHWEWRTRIAFLRVLDEFQPDLVYAWNLRGLCGSMVLTAQRRNIPVCCYVSDHWLAQWPEDDQWLAWHGWTCRYSSLTRGWRILESMLGTPKLPAAQDAPHLLYVHYTSRFIQRATLAAGMTTAASEVIHWGVDTGRFSYRTQCRSRVKRLLFAGAIAPSKGAHTAVEAFVLLCNEYGVRDTTLSLAGAPISAAYFERLTRIVRQSGLTDRVQFLGAVDRSEMPRLYHEHDVFIFPSIWDEPFSIALLEALSCGLAVVATATGGTPEVLESESSALLFPKEQPAVCAQQLLRLCCDPKLVQRLRENARLTIEEKFRFETMLDRIENGLSECLGEGAKWTVRTMTGAQEHSAQ